jgi:hypothetical protein
MPELKMSTCVEQHRTSRHRRRAGVRRPAQDTIMVELQDTIGGSSGGGRSAADFEGAVRSSDSEDCSLRTAGPAQPAEPRA